MSDPIVSAPTHPLRPFGWTEQVGKRFQPLTRAGLLPARVARVDGSACEVVVAVPGKRSAQTVRAGSARVRGHDPLGSPCTGDWVGISLADGRPPALAAMLPRTTVIVRGSASGRSQGQILAANVDIVAVTVSLAARGDLVRLERLLALGWESGAQPVVVLTKADTGYDGGQVSDVEAAAPGAEVLVVSALTGEGMDVLAARLRGATSVLVGQSGTGKSTLTNALAGAPVMAVTATRERDEKGRHTTTARELVPIPGGVLIDTPGLRGVGLYEAGEGLARAFADVEELARECRFTDCAHRSEPGCAVTAAVADGTLPARRVQSYHKLQRENEWMAARTDARLAAQRRREWKLRSLEGRRPRP